MIKHREAERLKYHQITGTDFVSLPLFSYVYLHLGKVNFVQVNCSTSQQHVKINSLLNQSLQI